MNVECPRCGEMEQYDGARKPRSRTAKLCSACYCEEFHFQCCLCGECGEVQDQHKLLVVFDASVGVPIGTYRIVRFPYFTQALVGSGFVHPWALKRIGDLPKRADADGYPCGHLCSKCQSIVRRGSDGRR